MSRKGAETAVFFNEKKRAENYMKVVCIGNSIVNGYPLKRSQCFASLWRQASGFEVISKGENGDVTSNVYARFDRDVISHKPNAVVILTGTNDFIYQIGTPEEVMTYLDKMAVLSAEHSIKAVLMTPLLTDPHLAKKYWIADVDYLAVNEKLKELRALMLDYGNNNGEKIIDAQDQYRRFYTEDNVTEYLLDGLHPTALGHETLARFLQEQFLI